MLFRSATSWARFSSSNSPPKGQLKTKKSIFNTRNQIQNHAERIRAPLGPPVTFRPPAHLPTGSARRAQPPRGHPAAHGHRLGGLPHIATARAACRTRPPLGPLAEHGHGRRHPRVGEPAGPDPRPLARPPVPGRRRGIQSALLGAFCIPHDSHGPARRPPAGPAGCAGPRMRARGGAHYTHPRE